MTAPSTRSRLCLVWLTKYRSPLILRPSSNNRSTARGVEMSGKYSRGVALCLIATLSWGGMFPVMTRALRHIDPFTFTCMRYAIAGVVFALLLARREGRAGFSLRGARVGLAWFFGTAGFAGFQFLV